MSATPVMGQIGDDRSARTIDVPDAQLVASEAGPG